MVIMSMVCLVGMVQHGAGRWEADIPDEWQSGLNFWSYIIGPFSTTGISLVKISVALFLLRFMQARWASRFVIGVGTFCFIFMVYSIITFMVACIPLSTFWNPQPGAKCWSGDALTLIGTINGGNFAMPAIICISANPISCQCHYRSDLCDCTNSYGDITTGEQEDKGNIDRHPQSRTFVS